LRTERLDGDPKRLHVDDGGAGMMCWADAGWQRRTRPQEKKAI
jgi:hypothetical protein